MLQNARCCRNHSRMFFLYFAVLRLKIPFLPHSWTNKFRIPRWVQQRAALVQIQLIANKDAVTWSDNLLVDEIANLKCQTKHPEHFQSYCKSIFFQTTSLLCLVYLSPSLTPMLLFSQASVVLTGLHCHRWAKPWIISFQTFGKIKWKPSNF